MKTTWPRYHRIAHIVLTVVGMAGIVGLFFPFVEAESAHSEAGPLFSAGFITAGSTLWISSGKLSRAVSTGGYVLAVLEACFVIPMITIFCVFGILVFPGKLSLYLPLMVVILGPFALGRNGLDQRARTFNPVLAMQLGYLAYAAIVLSYSFNRPNMDWAIGSYLILIASLAYLLQIILVTFQPRVGKEVKVADSSRAEQ